MPATSIPFTFEPNQGQSDPRVRYLGRAAGAALWLIDSGIVVRSHSAVLRLNFAGANRHPRVEGGEPTGAYSNYFPADSSRWRTGIPHYERVRYSGIYPGIDLVFYGNPDSLEYDWIVHPGADPRAIRMSAESTTSVEISEDGDLMMKTGGTEFRAHKPRIYQKDRQIPGRFVLHGKEAGFEIAQYDRRQSLIIDPVLSYATYIGGSTLSFGVQQAAGNLTFQDNAYGVAADSQGNVIIVGGTYSSDFPVMKGFDATTNAGWSGVVMKVNPKASTPAQFIVWSTFLGGSALATNNGEAQARAVAVDKQGNIYVTGYEAGTFPVQNAFQTTSGGGTCAIGTACHDAFVSKISADGSTLMYSSYLGGSSDDYGYAIAVDGSGNAYVGGQTKSANFPLNRGYQGTIMGASSGFITIVNPTGQQTIASSFFGGERDQSVNGIAADNSGNVYVTGWTTSTKFPLMNAFQNTPQAANGTNYDGFAAELNASTSGLHLLYSTYLGGTQSSTSMNGIAIDSQGDMIVIGATAASNYPVSANAYQSKISSIDAVITKLKPSATGKAQLIYSTFYGGTGATYGQAIAIDSAGRFILGGETISPDLPVTADGFQPYYLGIITSTTASIKSFIAIIDPTQPSQLVYGTYFGGLVDEDLTALTLDSTGINFVGLAFSSDMYTSPNAFQTGLNKVSKIFFARIDLTLASPLINSVTNAASYAQVANFVPGEMVTFFGTNIGPQQLQYSSVDNTGHLGNTIAGCQVIINGVAAPMVYASATQTSAIVPYEIAGNLTSGSTVYSRILCNGIGSNAYYTVAGSAAPGIFAAGSGTQGAILNADGSYNSAANPAQPGSIIVLFATGEGTLNPAGQDGRIENGPASSLPTPTQTVQVTFAGIPAASIPFVGVAPQSVDGLLQVNAQIPLNSPTGNVPLVLTVGKASSQANLTVAIAAQ